MTKNTHFEGLPSREQILAFIQSSNDPAGKREIAREFGLRGHEKIALKALLKDMTDEISEDTTESKLFVSLHFLAS